MGSIKKLILLSIVCFVFFTISMYSQVKVHQCHNIYCSANTCPICKDTLVDPESITSFYVENPTEDEDLLYLLSKLTNLKELWLQGNDMDSFKEWTSKEFGQLVVSKSLTSIYIRNIEYSEKFKRFIKDRYKNITVKDF